MKTLLTATFFATMAHSAFTNPAEQYAIDLTSDTAWTLSLDGAAPRPIKVPGGGWNSDQQSPPIQVMKDVKDFEIYERTITIPKLMPQQ